MQKFTIFTILLTVVVIVVVAEVAVNRYLPELDLPGDLAAVPKNYLGADVLGSFTGKDSAADNNVIDNDVIDEDTLSDLDFLPVYDEDQDDGTNVDIGDTDVEKTPATNDFEDSNVNKSYVAPTANVYLRDEQIKSAGFADAYLKKEDHEGLLFKTINIADLKDTEIEKYTIGADNVLFAKVYVFKVGIETEIGTIYDILKQRAAENPGVIVNETGQYGSASFFMNDSQRTSTAFLTARIGSFIYAFSYPKEFHPQIKNLIQLLVWEIG
ncbi:hypothetical protein HYW82_02165 [Candidatus Peregrinibacteria bacterium]|nr:hypothetical protein [Candidatus Peregrinibacteria bacterium]